MGWMRGWCANSRRLAAASLALALPAAAVAPSAGDPSAGPPLPDQLSVGDWTGHATAIGVTNAGNAQLTIIIQGTFGVPLSFTVPNDGPTTGRWTLNGTTNWTLLFPEGAGTAFATHSANGEMVGDRTQIGLGRSTIVTAGSVSIPSAPTVPISSADPFGPLDLRVNALLCDDVLGEWILSWNSLLSGAQFSPTFRGNWQARRNSGDGPSAERTAQILPEVFELRDRLINTWNEAEIVDGVAQLPLEIITELIHESVALLNELNNLSDCDREYLGEDNVRQWIYSFTSAVSLLTLALNDAANAGVEGLVAPPPPIVPAQDLAEWATVLASSGAVGAGSIAPGSAEVYDSLLSQVVAASQAPAATDAERVSAAALAVQLGVRQP